MTLSERYKNRKILKEQDAAPTQNQDKPPEEKIEELRGQLKEMGRSIKIPSLKKAFAEAIKEIAKFETKDEIDLSAEWESLKPIIQAVVKESSNWNADDENSELGKAVDNLKNFSTQFDTFEKLIAEFQDKDKLSKFFEVLKGIHDRFDNFVEERVGQTEAGWIKFIKTSKALVQGIESFMEKFEAQAKLDPKKIIENVEGLIAQSKDLMRRLGKFFEKGNYLTDENKNKTLEEILGGQAAPAAAGAAS